MRKLITAAMLIAAIHAIPADGPVAGDVWTFAIESATYIREGRLSPVPLSALDADQLITLTEVRFVDDFRVDFVYSDGDVSTGALWEGSVRFACPSCIQISPVAKEWISAVPYVWLEYVDSGRTRRTAQFNVWSRHAGTYEAAIRPVGGLFTGSVIATYAVDFGDTDFSDLDDLSFTLPYEPWETETQTENDSQSGS